LPIFARIVALIIVRNAGVNVTKTNLITGFLGSGKTTSILHMLANKDPTKNGPFWSMNLAKWASMARYWRTAAPY
jgi:hypothetical protein